MSEMIQIDLIYHHVKATWEPSHMNFQPGNGQEILRDEYQYWVMFSISAVIRNPSRNWRLLCVRKQHRGGACRWPFPLLPWEHMTHEGSCWSMGLTRGHSTSMGIICIQVHPVIQVRFGSYDAIKQVICWVVVPRSDTRWQCCPYNAVPVVWQLFKDEVFRHVLRHLKSQCI